MSEATAAALLAAVALVAYMAYLTVSGPPPPAA